VRSIPSSVCGSAQTIAAFEMPRPPTPLKGKMAAKAWRFKRGVAFDANKVRLGALPLHSSRQSSK